MIDHNLKTIKDFARCVPNITLLWSKIIDPMGFDGNDLAAPSRVVGMWDLAVTHLQREKGAAEQSAVPAAISHMGIDFAPKMSFEQRDLQKKAMESKRRPLA